MLRIKATKKLFSSLEGYIPVWIDRKVLNHSDKRHSFETRNYTDSFIVSQSKES